MFDTFLHGIAFMRVLVAAVSLLGASCLLGATCGDPASPGGTHYRGDFSNVGYTESVTNPKTSDGGGGVTCVTTYKISGYVELTIRESGETLTGEGTAEFVETALSVAPSSCGG